MLAFRSILCPVDFSAHAAQTGLFSARPGSVAYRVLTLTPTPVLVVPPSALQTNA